MEVEVEAAAGSPAPPARPPAARKVSPRSFSSSSSLTPGFSSPASVPEKAPRAKGKEMPPGPVAAIGHSWRARSFLNGVTDLSLSVSQEPAIAAARCLSRGGSPLLRGEGEAGGALRPSASSKKLAARSARMDRWMDG